MPELENIIVNNRPRSDGFRSLSGAALDSYSMTCNQGYMNMHHFYENGEYKIAIYKVRHKMRRQGYGKEMLRFARDHAQSLGATAITAHIVSLESLHAMSEVFGDEHIVVKKIGNYAPEGEDYNVYEMPDASLHYELL